MKGRSGDNPRARWARTRPSSIIDCKSESERMQIFATSCDVRKPSKKWTNGTRDWSVATWAMSAKS